MCYLCDLACSVFLHHYNVQFMCLCVMFYSLFCEQQHWVNGHTLFVSKAESEGYIEKKKRLCSPSSFFILFNLSLALDCLDNMKLFQAVISVVFLFCFKVYFISVSLSLILV